MCLLETFPRANEFALCEDHTFGIRTLPFAFLFSVREVRPSLNAGGLLLPSFDTATFWVGVLAVRMRTCEKHGIARSAGISGIFLAF